MFTKAHKHPQRASSEDLIDLPDLEPHSEPLGLLSPETLHQVFSAALADLSQPAYIEDDRVSAKLRSGLDLLFDLLGCPDLAELPLLHASVHAAVAINMPFVMASDCRLKLVYLNRADCILYDLKTQEHADGNCQGCMYAKIQDENGKLRKEDESDCAWMLRLKKVIETEEEAVREFNWGGGKF